MLQWFRSLFGGKEESPPVTLEALQGRWRMVSVGRNGNFAPPQAMANVKIVMTIQGENYFIESNGTKSDSGLIRLDTTQNPVHFDQVITGGDDAGNTHLGIVRFRDGLLENCQGEKGHPRPKDFARKRNDDASLASFRKL